MFPKPTAEPAAANTKPILLEKLLRSFMTDILFCLLFLLLPFPLEEEMRFIDIDYAMYSQIFQSFF